MTPATPPWWLRTLRYGVALFAVALAASIPMTPGLAPWSAAVLVPAAVGYALLVALPLALVMRALGWKGPTRAAIAGLIIFGGPLALIALFAGAFGEAALLFSVGAGGGLATWLLARLQSTTDFLIPGRVGVLAGAVFSLAVLSGTLMVAAWGSSAIHGPEDLSCHNLGRYEARSFPVRQKVMVRLSEQDWARFRTVMNEIASRDGWSLRDYTRDQSLGMSLCQEIGTKLSIQQWTWIDPPWPAVELLVIAPQGGEAWRPAVEKVLTRLESEWPDAVDRDAQGVIPPAASNAVAPAQPSGRTDTSSDRFP